MPEHLLLIDDLKHWKKDYPAGYSVVAVKDYLGNPQWAKKSSLRVTNLCRDLSYQSPGYYASLLAEARGHRMIPAVRTLQDLSRKTLYGPILDDLDSMVTAAFGKQPQSTDIARFEIAIHFGQCESPALKKLARKLYEAFRVPILRVEFRRNGRWRISKLKAGNLAALSHPQQETFFKVLGQYLRKPWQKASDARQMRYDLAILHNPEEALPPSDKHALAAFIRAAQTVGIAAELITPKDFGRLAEYDALFIRETTALNHHTYRFARKAASEGMVVIDDPESILRCVNKIFLNELLAANRISTPTSVMLIKGEKFDKVEQQLGYPLVLKIPDGSFSRGMFKVTCRAELEQRARELFEHSELILAQAYTYTDFDWRVGVLNGEVLYVCRYYMSRGHWQIIDHSATGKPKEGKSDTLDVGQVPTAVIQTALKAARLIGNGLYGVDIKETDQGILVIEVNDNPSIDSGVEDKLLGDGLYQKIMQEFLRRLDARGLVTKL
jgi:glutathione synthase/RimK-type ligase-like ATP-grasp enzyme